MSETARKATAEAERVAAVVLPEPAPEVVPLAEAPPALGAEIRARMAQVDVEDTASIVGFGSKAQEGLQEISRSMLEGVRNKDVGPAGDSLRAMVAALRGFGTGELDVRRTRTLWEKLTGRLAPIARFQARFEQVQGQIDRIADDLLKHEHQLLKDIESLDTLYDRTLAFYDELALYIAAGEAKLAEIDRDLIPAREAEARAAPEAEGVLKAQALRDMRAARDDLERRVHDLRLTRQVTMQSLPSIRLLQENDKSLVTRIGSTLLNTVPLWETQLAQGVAIQRSADAAGAVREAHDLTNELLSRNADTLRASNRMVREEVERSAFDVDAVRRANDSLIATITESLSIADEGRARRGRAEGELQRMEASLRDALGSAQARAGGAPVRPARPVPRSSA